METQCRVKSVKWGGKVGLVGEKKVVGGGNLMGGKRFSDGVKLVGRDIKKTEKGNRPALPHQPNLYLEPKWLRYSNFSCARYEWWNAGFAEDCVKGASKGTGQIRVAEPGIRRRLCQGHEQRHEPKASLLCRVPSCRRDINLENARTTNPI